MTNDVRTRGAVTAMYAGLGITVACMLAVVADQATGNVLGGHLATVYADYANPTESQSWVLSYLFTLGVLGVATWLTTVWAVRKNKRWARAGAVAAFLVGTGLAVLNLTVSDVGHDTLLPTSFGLAGLLPSVAGLVAVVWLYRPVSASAAARR